MNTAIAITVTPGEYWDRITILWLKLDRVKDPEKLKSVQDELDRLAPWQLKKYEPKDAAALIAELHGVNGELWHVEDALRHWEVDQVFGAQFISNAREVYKLNDKRFALKSKINELYGTASVEVKQLPAYVVNP